MPQDANTDDNLDLDLVLSTGENNDRDTIPKDNEDEGGDSNEKKGGKNVSTPPDSSDLGDEGSSRNGDEGDEGDEENSEIDELKDTINNFTSDDVSEEDEELRDSLLNKYKGSSFNDDGDVVDENGNVIKTLQEVYDDINEESIKLDDKGNQVNDNGEIVKTKFELAVENSQVNKLHKESGYSLLDENGEPKIYEDTDEGLKNFTDDLAEEKAKEINSRLFNSNPVIPEVVKHLLSGKSLETFDKIIDYSKVDPKVLSKDEKLGYIKESLLINGMPESRAENYLKLIVDSNKIDSELQTSLENLEENQEELKAKRNEEYQEAVRKQQEETVNYWNGVEKQIKENNVKFVTIPEKEKEAFYNYMSMAVDDNGNSQHLLDKQKQPLEEEIGLAYLRYKGFNFDSVINKKVNQKRTLSLKERIKRSASKANSQVSGSKKEGKVNPEDVDIRVSDIL